MFGNEEQQEGKRRIKSVWQGRGRRTGRVAGEVRHLVEDRVGEASDEGGGTVAGEVRRAA